MLLDHFRRVGTGGAAVPFRRRGRGRLPFRLVGDLVEDRDELGDERLERRPVRLLPQVRVAEFLVGLGQNRVEVERGLFRFLLALLLLPRVVLDLVGHLFQVVDLVGKEQARFDRRKIDFIKDSGDARLERLEVGADLVGRLSVGHGIVRLDQHDEPVVAAEIPHQVVVVLFRGRFVVDQVAGVVHHREPGHQHKHAQGREDDARSEDDSRLRAHQAGHSPHDALQDSVYKRHGEGKLTPTTG